MKLKFNGKYYQCNHQRLMVNLILMLTLIIIGNFINSNTIKADVLKPIQTIIVTKGDTLWQIAAKYYPGIDPRLVIEKIKRDNNLITSNIKRGQRLRLAHW